MSNMKSVPVWTFAAGCLSGGVFGAVDRLPARRRYLISLAHPLSSGRIYPIRTEPSRIAVSRSAFLFAALLETRNAPLSWAIDQVE